MEAVAAAGRDKSGLVIAGCIADYARMAPASFRKTAIFRVRDLWIPAALLAAGCASLPEEGRGTGLAGIDRLTPEARGIVLAALSDAGLAEVCAGGPPAVREAVRGATVRAMFGGGLDEPRVSGTAAGHFIADRCREIDPEY